METVQFSEDFADHAEHHRQSCERCGGPIDRKTGEHLAASITRDAENEIVRRIALLFVDSPSDCAALLMRAVAGLTLEQISERLATFYGREVSRAAISQKLTKLGDKFPTLAPVLQPMKPAALKSA